MYTKLKVFFLGIFLFPLTLVGQKIVNTAGDLVEMSQSGNVISVGTTINMPIKLEVNGSSTNKSAFNATAGTSIDFSLSNLAYTSASPGAFTLNNIKDGGTYTLAVQGTTAGTASFTTTGFTYKSINNGVTIAGKQTLYSFIVMGTTVYYYMSAGY